MRTKIVVSLLCLCGVIMGIAFGASFYKFRFFLAGRNILTLATAPSLTAALQDSTPNRQSPPPARQSSTLTPTYTPTPKTSFKGSFTVYLASDSTVQASGANYYQAGWGQMIPEFFTTDVKFDNRAIGGKSSKTFIKEGLLDAILSVIQPNDYLFIQFGHNDANARKPDRYTEPYGAFKDYLRQYVDRTRERKAIPVLITPVARLNYKNGVFINDFPDYCAAMKQVAIEKNCKIIDLMTKSINYLTAIGFEEAYTLYLVSSNGADFTHFTEKGATQIARLVAEGVKELNIPISQYVK